MKPIMFAIVSAVYIVAFADKTQTPKKVTLAPGEFEARARANYERRTGGKVLKPGSAQGKVLFLNAQKKVPVAALQGAFNEISSNVHPMLEIKDVPSLNLLNLKTDIEAKGGKIGVAIVDSNDMPALLTAPEEGWSIVNVGKLSEGTDSLDVIATRTRKEILRAFALAGGCAFLSRTQIVLRDDVRKPKDLDSPSIEECYGVEALMSLERILPTYGVMPWKQTTYKKACQEGWAAQPTNEYQKAIWDEVRSLPQKPMRIEYDAKRGK